MHTVFNITLDWVHAIGRGLDSLNINEKSRKKGNKSRVKIRDSFVGKWKGIIEIGL